MPAGHLPQLVLGLALAALGCASGASPATAPDAARRDATLLDVTAPAAARAGEPDPAARKAPHSSAADRPGRLLIYSAITGHQPLDDPAAVADDPTRTPVEREVARAAALEAEIAGELERQEQISTQDDSQGALPPAPALPPEAPSALEAAPAPEERELPAALFTIEQITIPRGEWQNTRELEVERRTLDADRDGRPEEVRYLDPATGALLRAEQDRDFDGQIDTWKTYADGVLGVRILDENGDERADVWERYENGRMAQLTLDRNHDGVRDVFLRYKGLELHERLEDANDDGTIDRVVSYTGKRRVRAEEDLSFNGKMDTWTSYALVDGREVVARVERDTQDAGRPNIVESYETIDGETRIVRREEDLNRDGKADVVSVYEKGRLVQRAISDEALAPL
jgi:hypothetical protein